MSTITDIIRVRSENRITSLFSSREFSSQIVCYKCNNNRMLNNFELLEIRFTGNCNPCPKNLNLTFPYHPSEPWTLQQT